jgi:hypothetical protein
MPPEVTDLCISGLRAEPGNRSLRLLWNSLAEETGPSFATWQTWPAVGWILGSVLLACGVYFLGRRFQRRGWLVGALLVIILIVFVGQQERAMARYFAQPLGVLSSPQYLKAGNGELYDALLPTELPVATVVKIIAERPGWCQVELATGVKGWFAKKSLIMLK